MGVVYRETRLGVWKRGIKRKKVSITLKGE